MPTVWQPPAQFGDNSFGRQVQSIRDSGHRPTGRTHGQREARSVVAVVLEHAVVEHDEDFGVIVAVDIPRRRADAFLGLAYRARFAACRYRRLRCSATRSIHSAKVGIVAAGQSS